MLIKDRLHLLTGKVLLVNAPSELVFDEVRSRHELLLEFATQLEHFDNELTDDYLLAEYRDYYCAIAELLKPTFDPSELTRSSRHRFFICTETFPHPKKEGVMVRGLSLLEKLMGFDYGDFDETPKPPKATLTTGDTGLDLRSALLLQCKENFVYMLENYSRQQLVAIVAQINDLQRGEEALREKQKEIDRERFNSSAGNIAAFLQAEGFSVPPEFLN